MSLITPLTNDKNKIMPTAIIFDTEATGIHDPVIIEAAWLELDTVAPFTLGPAFVQRYNPGKPISLGALATHHILDEELTDCPPASAFALPSGLKYLIGHNIDFDWQAIGSPEIKRICTLALSRRAWPEIDSHSQSALLYFLERSTARERLRNAHSAQADVEICATILKHVCEEFGITSMEALWEKSEQARLPTHMPFGKHKGMQIELVPKDYVRWLLGQQDIDPYLRTALQSAPAK
jgi:exodeoxyribonuclease X